METYLESISPSTPTDIYTTLVEMTLTTSTHPLSCILVLTSLGRLGKCAGEMNHSIDLTMYSRLRILYMASFQLLVLCLVTRRIPLSRCVWKVYACIITRLEYFLFYYRVYTIYSSNKLEYIVSFISGTQEACCSSFIVLSLRCSVLLYCISIIPCQGILLLLNNSRF
jgi:hypothetical protein